MRKIHLILILTSALMASCGEFAYKRGAGANDFASAKKECEARSNDSKLVAQCLQDNGWTVQKMDELDPFATASVNSDNRAIAPSDSGHTYTNTKNTELSTDSATPISNTSSVNEAANAATEKTVQPADPLDKFIVSSWWKIGGSADSLQTAINQCVAQLGEAHRPNPVTHETTRGLGVCMRDKGWRGLKAQK